MIEVEQEQLPDMAFLLSMLLEAAYPPTERRPSNEEALRDPRIQQWLLDFGKVLGDLAVVAYDGDQPIGAAWCRVFDREQVHGIVGVVDEDIPALAIGVRSAYRGQGVGTSLLEKLCDVCRQKGFEAVSLAVGRSNPALTLYERSGFQAVLRHPVFVMRRALDVQSE